MALPPESPLTALIKEGPTWLFDAFAREGVKREQVESSLVALDITDRGSVSATFMTRKDGYTNERRLRFGLDADAREQLSQFLRKWVEDKRRRNRLELIDVLAAGDGQVWSDFWTNPEQQRIGETMYGKQADEILNSSWLAKQKGGWAG